MGSQFKFKIWTKLTEADLYLQKKTQNYKTTIQLWEYSVSVTTRNNTATIMALVGFNETVGTMKLQYRVPENIS